ncbi:hypothetical protein [Limnoraphis robusta]|uniref:hypothetical protein n=1 Tax=Limnoraphis robusta TaxID=1118279 RepID=UPI00139626D1|nr:hypothetical protein [Limnoraphis robusta]
MYPPSSLGSSTTFSFIDVSCSLRLHFLAWKPVSVKRLEKVNKAIANYPIVKTLGAQLQTN